MKIALVAVAALLFYWLVISRKVSGIQRPSTQSGARVATGRATTNASAPGWIGGLLNSIFGLAAGPKTGPSGFAATTNQPYGATPTLINFGVTGNASIIDAPVVAPPVASVSDVGDVLYSPMDSGSTPTLDPTSTQWGLA